MKAYTDLEQSKKLAEILPLESADMWWLYVTAQGKYIAMMYEEPNPHYLIRMESYGIKDAAIRCWSLAALLEVLPPRIHDICTLEFGRIYTKKDWYVAYNNAGINYYFVNSNLIDACFEMIVKLKEKDLI